MLINKETCLRTAKFTNELLEKEKIDRKVNFVYISAERGFPFPLSLKFEDYLKSKRQTEKELLDHNKYNHLNPIILRPGFIKDNRDKPWSVAIYHSFNFIHFTEKNLLIRIFPDIREIMQLPAHGIELETLAKFACSGAAGNLTKQIYSNDEMIRDIKNLSLI